MATTDSDWARRGFRPETGDEGYAETDISERRKPSDKEAREREVRRRIEAIREAALLEDVLGDVWDRI